MALDFVNTVSWRLDPDRRVDRLPDSAAVTRWAYAVGLIEAAQAEDLWAQTAADPATGREVAEQCRELREALYRLLRPVACGASPSRVDTEWVRRAVTNALAHAEVTTVVPWRWEIALRELWDLPRALSLAVGRLLQWEDLNRLRECQDSGCGWLFLDRSKNASRVWCSSSDCGNRNRARRHYLRRRDQSSQVHRRRASDRPEPLDVR